MRQRLVANLQQQTPCSGLLRDRRWRLFIRTVSLGVAFPDWPSFGLQADFRSVLFMEDRYDQK